MRCGMGLCEGSYSQSDALRLQVTFPWLKFALTQHPFPEVDRLAREASEYHVRGFSLSRAMFWNPSASRSDAIAKHRSSQVADAKEKRPHEDVFLCLVVGIDKQLKSAIDLSPITHLQYQDAHHAIFDVGDDSVVTHAVLPKLPQLGALQSLSYAAWVIEHSHSLAQECQDTSGHLLVQLGQLFHGHVFKLNPPSQGCAPHHPENGS